MYLFYIYEVNPAIIVMAVDVNSPIIPLFIANKQEAETTSLPACSRAFLAQNETRCALNSKC